MISLAELDRKIEETIELGGTQILLQGGHHPKLGKQWYLDLLSHVKERFPQINIHGFSPSEFVHFREVFNEPLERIIADFRAAGLGSIPGGGGEILVDRVRKKVSPLKAMSDDWLEVMGVAHRLGLNSSATMMFGHVETRADRVEHLERVRAQQDQTKGFTAFIALDLPGGPYAVEGADGGGARVSADPGGSAHLSGQFCQRAEFVGDAGPGPRPGGVEVWRQRPGQHHDRGERGFPGGHELPDDRRRHAPAYCGSGYEPHQRDNWYRLVN